MIDRKEALKAIARFVNDTDIVLPVYSTAFDWIDIRPNLLNYVSHGAMGLASSHALGLALGRPDRRVIVLDGDGSLLMNIGTLVTTAEAAPKNLYHFVMENGTYEAERRPSDSGERLGELRRLCALGRAQERARVLRPQGVRAAGRRDPRRARPDVHVPEDRRERRTPFRRGRPTGTRRVRAESLCIA